MAILASIYAPPNVHILPLLPPSPVVVIYEDLETARQSRDNWPALMRRLDLPENYPSSYWKLNLLDNPKLRELAANEAGQAGIIIISVRGDRDLLDELKQGLEHWLTLRASGTGTLMVLLDHNHETYYERHLIRNYLKGLAERTGSRCWCESLE